MWFRRKKKIDIPVETKQVGSVLWPYVSNVEVPNAKVISSNISDLNDRVEVLENKPDNGISIDDVKTYVDPKLRGLNDKIDNLPNGTTLDEVKTYVDPKIRELKLFDYQFKFDRTIYLPRELNIPVGQSETIFFRDCNFNGVSLDRVAIINAYENSCEITRNSAAFVIKNIKNYTITLRFIFVSFYGNGLL